MTELDDNLLANPVPAVQRVVVDTQGVRFGPHCWYSHEKITGFSAEELNNGPGNLIARNYMGWVRSMLAGERA